MDTVEILRWFFWPLIIGFIFCLFLNPLVAGPGFIVWLAVIHYVYRRATSVAGPDG